MAEGAMGMGTGKDTGMEVGLDTGMEVGLETREEGIITRIRSM